MMKHWNAYNNNNNTLKWLGKILWTFQKNKARNLGIFTGNQIVWKEAAKLFIHYYPLCITKKYGYYF